MSQKSIVLYLHVHQPCRVRHYTIFDIGVNHDYFNAPPGQKTNNEQIIHKVAEKSYLPTNRKLLKEILAPLGYEVWLAADGAEALAVVARGLPDVILLDVIMPNRDGGLACGWPNAERMRAREM